MAKIQFGKRSSFAQKQKIPANIYLLARTWLNV